VDLDESWSGVFGVATGVDVIVSSFGDSSIAVLLWFSVSGSLDLEISDSNSFAACKPCYNPRRVSKEYQLSRRIDKWSEHENQIQQTLLPFIKIIKLNKKREKLEIESSVCHENLHHIYSTRLHGHKIRNPHCSLSIIHFMEEFWNHTKKPIQVTMKSWRITQRWHLQSKYTQLRP